jgi:hypothetical protein
MSSEAASRLDPGSFRDPAARVFRCNGQVFRYVDTDALRDWERLSATRFFKQFTSDGRLIATERSSVPPLPLCSPWVAVLRHQTIPVVSYPYEWCFSMLRDAAMLQLELLLSALDEGMTLKDATPFNIQWIGTRPVFIDTGSFKRAEAGEPWAGYRQFCEMFLYPLLLQAYKNVPFHPWLRGSLEGIEARHFNSLLSLRDWFRPGVLTHVYLLSKLQSRYEGTSRDVRKDLRAAGFGTELVKANVRRMRGVVSELRWKRARSTWSDYADCNTYDADDRERKTQFVRVAAGVRRRSLVWDLGCNIGEYSRVVSQLADRVVSIDADHAAIERLYLTLKDEGNETILPLVGDVTNPSPGLGWRNRERQTLLDRGRPDLIMALALVHHLALARNVPLPELVEWFAQFDSEVIVEFVAPEDAMVQRLLRNRQRLDFRYTQDRFEESVSKHFVVVARDLLQSRTRTIYHLKPRSAS